MSYANAFGDNFLLPQNLEKARCYFIHFNIFLCLVCRWMCVCLIGIKLVLKLFIFEKDIFKMVSCHA